MNGWWCEMCLGIPGRVVEMLPGNAEQLALVDVLGAQRPINLGMLEEQKVTPGEWLLIHMGFAIEHIDQERATTAMAGLELMGRAAGADDPRLEQTGVSGA